MFRLGRPSPAQLRVLLSAMSAKEPSYPEVGGSGERELPQKYLHQDLRQRIGEREGFTQAAEALRLWTAHRGAGMDIHPEDARIRLSETVLVIVRFGPLRMVAPCRIVRVIDEVDRYGFAYGTLPGHPERGEEAFVVERDDGGTFLHLRAFSRADAPLAKLSGPIGRALQRRASRRYLQAMQDVAARAIAWPAQPDG